MTIRFPSCLTCVRFNRNVKDKSVCEAYPDGIPVEIILGKDKHEKSRSDDKGLYYKPIKDKNTND